MIPKHTPSLCFQDIKAIYSSLPCYKSLDELFPPSTAVFMVGNPYYGAMGEVGQEVLGSHTAGKHVQHTSNDPKLLLAKEI